MTKIMYEKEEMGYEWMSRTNQHNPFVIINKDFFRKHFSGTKITHSQYFSMMNIELWIKTEIICPYCKKGVLELIKREKEICETHVCHTGNSYLFKCTHNECKAIFSYCNTFWNC